MKKLRKTHGLGGPNSFLETVPGPAAVPGPSRSVGVGVGGLPLFHEGGVRAGGDWETLPAVQYPVTGNHGYGGATPATMQMLQAEDAHEEGEEGDEDAEDAPPSSKRTTGRMGMASGSSCGFRGCSYASKDHGLMAKHRLSSHGLR